MNSRAQFGAPAFTKPKYTNTKVFHYLAKQYFSFSPFSVLEKRGPGLFLQYFQNTTVLVNTSVLTLHYLLHPNTLKYLILQYFQKLKYYLNNSKILWCQTGPSSFSSKLPRQSRNHYCRSLFSWTLFGGSCKSKPVCSMRSS
jgi:hypothetical protein